MKRKMIAAISSVVMVLSIALIYSVQVKATEENIVKRRAVIMSAPYDSGPIREHNNICMQEAFQANNVDIDGNEYKYSVYSYVNNQPGHSIDTFLNAIRLYLSSADSNDISYIYINAHGGEDGRLGVNGSSSSDPALFLSDLKQCLDSIQGKIVLMIEACYAGAAISSGEGERTGAVINTNLAQIMIDEFFEEDTRNGEFEGSNKYCVICACESDESAFAFPHYGSDGQIDDNFQVGTATYAWARTLGYNYFTGVYSHSFPADMYGDDVVNPTDLSIYTGSLISQYALTSMYHQEYPGMTQTMAYYAHNQMTSIFYKNYMTGDVNLDKQVTMADALKLSQYLAGLTALDSRAQLLADTNQNGIVNSADFDELRYFLSGISTN